MARPSQRGKKPVAAKKGGNGKKPRGGKRPGGGKQEKSVRQDVFSDEEDDEKEARMNDKMDIDGVYEYEMPETFEHDSEISEDEAFNSDDEEQYGIHFGGNKRINGRSGEEPQEGDDDDDEDADGGNLLSDMLGTAPAQRLSTAADADADDDDVFDHSDDEDVSDAATKAQNLMALVDQLVPAKKKKKLTDITEESLSRLEPASMQESSDSGELTLSALLAGGSSDAASASAKVKKQIRELEADATVNGPLTAASAPIVEARATRKVAYDQKRDELDLFQPVVKRNRQKETMDFREQIPKMENLTSAALASKFNAETSLEKDVEALLKAGGLSDRTLAKEENDELLQKKVSAEEVMQRQKELAKMRSLMFYEEQKARRVKKIKSKLYHKIRNNQNKKEQDKQRAQLRELDPELAKQLDAELAEKRAEERMTLKHTNTSKWVKHQLKRGIQADNETRSAIAEQLRRGDDLRRKMQTVDSDEEDLAVSDGDEDDGTDPVTRLQNQLQKQADALVTEINEDEANASKVKGLAGMKFMQRAVQKQREKARSEAEKLLREIKGESTLLSDDDGVSDDDAPAPKRRNKKQKSSAPQASDHDKEAVAKALPRGALQTGNVSMDKGLSARSTSTIAVNLDTETVSKVTVDAGSTRLAGSTVELGMTSHSREKGDDTAKEEPVPIEAEENPWLNGVAAKTKKGKKNKKNKRASGVDVGNAIDALEKSVSSKVPASELDLTKAANATVNEKKRKVETADKAPEGSAAAKKTKKVASIESSGATKGALSQEELVRRAFAFADEDENEIAQEKDDLAAQDADAKKGAEIAKLVGMSGWGSWAGVGVQKSHRQKHREDAAKKLAEDTKKQALASRKDSKMERVLINEKKDKRAAKYAVQEVPYPFTSREEYEMAMRNPLGSDWNTPAATNALTAPRLITRAGQMIDPLKLSKEDKKQAKKELTKKRKARF